MTNQEYIEYLKKLLLESDYTVLPDVPLTTSCKGCFLAWRSTIRTMLITFESTQAENIPVSPPVEWEEI
jgi:hypothetical protein